MTSSQFRQQPFAYGTATLAGASGVIVATLDESLKPAKVTAQFTPARQPSTGSLPPPPEAAV
jgi:hypothetical protein